MALFICSNCGYGTASWMGRCPNCSEFNTFKEQQGGDGSSPKETKKMIVTPFKKIQNQTKSRLASQVFEFDRVIGGGIVPGEVIFLSGEPGVGKSTLLL